MITCNIPGRIRIRVPQLKQPEAAEVVGAIAKEIPGMLSVTVNSRVGSALLIYDPVVLPPQELMNQGMLLLKQMGIEEPAKKAVNLRNKYRNHINQGISLSLGGVVVSSLLSKRLHEPLAILFLGFAISHLWLNKKWFWAQKPAKK